MILYCDVNPEILILLPAEISTTTKFSKKIRHFQGIIENSTVNVQSKFRIIEISNGNKISIFEKFRNKKLVMHFARSDVFLSQKLQNLSTGTDCLI